VLGEIRVETLAAHRLDRQAEPVSTDPVLPSRARIEQQGGVDADLRATQNIRRAGDGVVSQQVLATEPVPVARGVIEQLPDGGLRRGWAQPGPVTVDPLEDLQVAEVEQDRGDRLLEP
jgi:hypothetical protein